MYQLVYASSATIPFRDTELRALLEVWQRNNARVNLTKRFLSPNVGMVWQRNNARVNLTGMLLYKDGNIMQVLEGEESAVLTMYDRIVQDPRHRGVLTFLKGPIPERNFSIWSMAYRNLDLDSASIPGYSEFLNSPLTDDGFAKDPSRCQRLLMIFKEKLR